MKSGGGIENNKLKRISSPKIFDDITQFIMQSCPFKHVQAGRVSRAMREEDEKQPQIGSVRKQPLSVICCSNSLEDSPDLAVS